MVNVDDLTGKPYQAEINDCFQIGRKYFARLGIDLTDYAFPSDFWNYDDSLYEKHFEKEGFFSIPTSQWKPQIHDVMLVRGSTSATFPTHAGILVASNKVLHHYTGRFSEVTDFKGQWRQPALVLRHKDVTIDNSDPEVINVVELMPEHVRRRVFGTTQK